MFQSLFETNITLVDGTIVRRTGPFHRTLIELAQVQRVVAVSRDAVTHDEVVLVFIGSNGEEFWVSEFDKNFAELVEGLKSTLPGFGSLDDLSRAPAFSGARSELWKRNGRGDGAPS